MEEVPTAMQHLDIEAKAREYTVDVAWSDEDQRFIATMSEWGAAVIDGKTQEEALKRARAAIEGNIVRLLQQGRTLPTPHHVA
jgi:predicted RNase H-like HicB family nuclease